MAAWSCILPWELRKIKGVVIGPMTTARMLHCKCYCMYIVKNYVGVVIIIKIIHKPDPHFLLFIELCTHTLYTFCIPEAFHLLWLYPSIKTTLVSSDREDQ